MPLSNCFWSRDWHDPNIPQWSQVVCIQSKPRLVMSLILSSIWLVSWPSHYWSMKILMAQSEDHYRVSPQSFFTWSEIFRLIATLITTSQPSSLLPPTGGRPQQMFPLDMQHTRPSVKGNLDQSFMKKVCCPFCIEETYGVPHTTHYTHKLAVCFNFTTVLSAIKCMELNNTSQGRRHITMVIGAIWVRPFAEG